MSGTTGRSVGGAESAFAMRGRRWSWAACTTSWMVGVTVEKWSGGAVVAVAVVVAVVVVVVVVVGDVTGRERPGED